MNQIMHQIIQIERDLPDLGVKQNDKLYYSYKCSKIDDTVVIEPIRIYNITTNKYI